MQAQCLDCGASVGNPITHRAIRGPVPEWDYDLQREGKNQRLAALEAESDRWWEWYNGYLQSPEWRALRDLVLMRANGRCEGCGTAEPSEVHHLTYDHAGAEFLFELVALCTNCHERLHRETMPEEHG
jgi:5-methylcytosine-specific restriction endonuclease McrA